MNPVRRVPLDFAHPLKTRWPGYVNPYQRPCPETGKTCFDGVSAARKWLDTFAHLLSLAGEPRMHDRGVHPTLASVPHAHSFVPGQDFLTLVSKLAGKEPDRGSVNSYSIELGILRAAKLPDKWGWCPVCDADTYDPACKAEREAWEPTHPPTGDGYQLWGGYDDCPWPIMPVFETVEALALHAYTTACYRAGCGLPWLRFELTMHVSDRDVSWSYSGLSNPNEVTLYYERQRALLRKGRDDQWSWSINETLLSGTGASLLKTAEAAFEAIDAMPVTIEAKAPNARRARKKRTRG